MLRSEASSWPPIKNNWSNGLEEYFFFLVTGAKNVITGEWPPQCIGPKIMLSCAVGPGPDLQPSRTTVARRMPGPV